MTICHTFEAHCPGCGSTNVTPYTYSTCCDVPVTRNPSRCDGLHTAGRDYREPPFRDVDGGQLTFKTSEGGLGVVDEVLGYADGKATVMATSARVYVVPLGNLAAVRPVPGLGLKPVPWS